METWRHAPTGRHKKLCCPYKKKLCLCYHDVVYKNCFFWSIFLVFKKFGTTLESTIISEGFLSALLLEWILLAFGVQVPLIYSWKYGRNLGLGFPKLILLGPLEINTIFWCQKKSGNFFRYCWMFVWVQGFFYQNAMSHVFYNK